MTATEAPEAEAPESEGNALVAKPEEQSGVMNVNGDNWSEGSGPISDAAATIKDASSGNWGNLAMDAVNDGMDLLAVVMDPLGALASAGIGWLIEHISFLHDALDKLAGNPEEITAHGQTWTNISNQLKQAGNQYQSAKSTVLQSYQCSSATAYDNAGKAFTGVLEGASGHAENAATAMQVGGALVGTERGLIRDMISEFVGQLIVKAVAALAASFFTFGAAAAAFIADTVVEGGILAEKISTKIAKVIEQLEKLAKGAHLSASKLEDAEKALKKFGKDAKGAAKGKGDELNTKASNLKQKGADEQARLKAKDPNKSVAENKADEWKDKLADGGVGKLADKYDEKMPHGKDDSLTGNKSTYDKLKDFHEGNQEKSALDGDKWKEAASHKVHDGQEFHTPKPNNADAVAGLQEAGRQDNEQPERTETAEKEYGETERGEELKKYEDYEWPTEDQD